MQKRDSHWKNTQKALRSITKKHNGAFESTRYDPQQLECKQRCQPFFVYEERGNDT